MPACLELIVLSQMRSHFHLFKIRWPERNTWRNCFGGFHLRPVCFPQGTSLFNGLTDKSLTCKYGLSQKQYILKTTCWLINKYCIANIALREKKSFNIFTCRTTSSLNGVRLKFDLLASFTNSIPFSPKMTKSQISFETELDLSFGQLPIILHVQNQFLKKLTENLKWF